MVKRKIIVSLPKSNAQEMNLNTNNNPFNNNLNNFRLRKAYIV
ncbi:hypothetical protein SAMN04488034_10950 [Salinimicrobium catena]|uniref:Uncharacterized protein n=1 Tax=Salinimicrobium catena TaxID=390640 RepID=A0A1H5P8B9_9FLAO|nr:hypothetical protein [Salinimicrobium catena]SDL71233.1 hypothetical protein SAMN04488140_10932 [Salinimicrobium catena]SEF09277.1 hypothetical protein SAMN04488034_10950 [Salinimicrobium catena]